MEDDKGSEKMTENSVDGKAEMEIKSRNKFFNMALTHNTPSILKGEFSPDNK